MSSLKKIPYKISCEIHKLKINKNIDFQTKIMWKRHQNRAQTQPVKHAHGYSVFNEVLTLEFDMPYNPQKNLFESKNTELVAVIVYEGKVKSGGYAKYNLADNLNNHPNQTTKVTIPMTQCPDPSSFLQVSFTYQKLGQQFESDEMSILNASSRDLNMSRVDFKDDKLSIQMDKINDIIGKFQNLAVSVKRKGRQSGSKIPELMTRVQCLEGEKYSLLSSIQKLQKQLQLKQKQLKQQKKKARSENQQLEKQLEKKSKQIRDSMKISDKSKENIPNYKEMYESAVHELEELRNDKGTLRKSLDLRMASNLDDVQKIADFGQKSNDSQDEDNQKMEQLSRQNVQLQSKVASMSHKLAQLFNASYQYGGAKLLDYLQTSIGLTQLDQ